MRRLILVLALCAPVLSSCALAPTAPATPAPVPVLPAVESTAEPTRPAAVAPSMPTEASPAEASPTAKPSATLKPTTSAPVDGLVDDFSNPRSGWDIRSGKAGSMGYENGEYVIQVDEVDYSLWANPGREFGNVLVGVKAQLAEGSPTADMGLMCRYQNADNFMYGEITSDGFYGISQMKNGDLRVLTGSGKLQRHAAIRQGAEANQIQFLCAANRFTLIVNDQPVAGIEADAPAGGDVGLLAGTFEKAGARVRFDDFSAAGLLPRTEVPGSKVLFSDDFSDPHSGWDVRTTENGASGYQAGQYFIRVDKPKYQLWSTPRQTFEGDVLVEVAARLTQGPAENEIGVICDYQDQKNFIYGSVGTDGYYAISEVKDDRTKILTGDGKYQKSDAIPLGSESYNIRLACEGDRYTLFVNGEKIDSANSRTFSNGDVGLLAGAFDQGGVKVLFDNFSVSAP